MKTALIRLVWLPLLVGQLAFAQSGPPTQPTPSPQIGPAVEDFKPATTNQPGKQYPQVNSEGRVRARIVAPQAQSVMLDISGIGLEGRAKHPGFVARNDSFALRDSISGCPTARAVPGRTGLGPRARARHPPGLVPGPARRRGGRRVHRQVQPGRLQ